ncbi:MAG: hypothetical protein QM661_13615 [Solimonas sp.]
MKIHHLNCGSMCPHGRRFLQGAGGWLEPARIVCHCWLIEARNGLTLVDTGSACWPSRATNALPTAGACRSCTGPAA